MVKKVVFQVTVEYDDAELSKGDLECCIEDEVGGLYNCPGIHQVITSDPVDA